MILSGGTINSPQLLLLSGIGPADEIKKRGIKPRSRPAGRGQKSSRSSDGFRRLSLHETGKHGERRIGAEFFAVSFVQTRAARIECGGSRHISAHTRADWLNRICNFCSARHIT